MIAITIVYTLSGITLIKDRHFILGLANVVLAIYMLV
jgi:hypothetical protein